MILTLETKRLLLRPLEVADAEAMFAMDSNPNVHKYLWQKPTQTIDETLKIIENVRGQYIKNNIGRFATILKETGEFIGWTGIKYIDDHIENGNTNFFDYGYRLNENYWNSGFATEASVAWLDYGFTQMNIDKMNAYTHHENGASNRILKKIGMTLVESYPDKEQVTWNWWQMNNPNL
jgi:ribosomal-protein-alanine N-acetyltransferase